MIIAHIARFTHYYSMNCATAGELSLSLQLANCMSVVPAHTWTASQHSDPGLRGHWFSLRAA